MSENAGEFRQLSEPLQRALADAQQKLGHATQEQVVADLKADNCVVRQQTVSEWFKGPLTTETGRPRRIREKNGEALSRYLGRAGIQSLDPYRREPSPGSAPDVIPGEVAAFIEAGEPELGGRRARIVDAIIGRLEISIGPPTDNELALIEWLTEVQRFARPFRSPSARAAPPTTEPGD